MRINVCLLVACLVYSVTGQTLIRVINVITGDTPPLMVTDGQVGFVIDIGDVGIGAYSVLPLTGDTVGFFVLAQNVSDSSALPSYGLLAPQPVTAGKSYSLVVMGDARNGLDTVDSLKLVLVDDTLPAEPPGGDFTVRYFINALPGAGAVSFSVGDSKLAPQDYQTVSGASNYDGGTITFGADNGTWSTTTQSEADAGNVGIVFLSGEPAALMYCDDSNPLTTSVVGSYPPAAPNALLNWGIYAIGTIVFLLGVTACGAAYHKTCGERRGSGGSNYRKMGVPSYYS